MSGTCPLLAPADHGDGYARHHMPHSPTAPQGIRTFIATNVKPSPELIEEGKRHNETWAHYADDQPLRSLYAGDTRAGMVPFLAHKVLGG